MDNASESVASRVQQSAHAASTAILQFIAKNATANTGPAVLQAPLFKAGKPLTKYATVTDSPIQDQIEFKEVIVTAKHTHKVVVKVTQPSKEKIQQYNKLQEEKKKAAGPVPEGTSVNLDGDLSGDADAEQRLKKLENAPPPPAPSFDIRLDWTNSLASIVSVDPLFETISTAASGSAASNKEAAAAAAEIPVAIFSVMFLHPNKDAKNEEDSNKMASQDSSVGTTNTKEGQIVAKMTKKRTAFEWSMMALRRSSENSLTAAEADHLKHVFSLGKPSLRCRAYLVPGVLGGTAQRDEWVSVYRAAIQNYWHERLESSIIPAPEVFQYCTWAQFAGPANRANLTENLPSASFCLVALSTKKVYIVSALEANLLGNENGRIPPTATRSADISSISAVFAPGENEKLNASYVVGIECANRPFAQFQFLCGQHAADFVLEVQRVFLLLKGEDAEFPVMKQ